MIYGSAAKTTLEKLNNVHHQGLRLSSGAFCTSPVHSLYVITHEPSLQTRRGRLSLKYYFKIKSHHSHPIYILMSLIPILKLFIKNRPSCVPSFGLRMQILLDFNNLVNQEILPLEREQPPLYNDKIKVIDDLDRFPRPTTLPTTYMQLFYAHRQAFSYFKEIYTYGSKFNNHVASAVVFENAAEAIRQLLYCKSNNVLPSCPKHPVLQARVATAIPICTSKETK
ncbi:RNase H domain-containing protein [Caerostris extrusa]|uniref:RNase H domain-containing protein n=1 Tax=Caerostris extrusa TaxID=172846 RepID=A0AAV4P318_CAEEX|nr:RNase H domain-containing protein [Caerostris extrusa]